MCSTEILRNVNEFSNRLLLLKQGKKLTDVEIVTNNKRISAHKNILAVSSEYFENQFLFNNDTNSSVELENVDFDILKLLIDYCYTGKITICEENVRNVIEVANYLGIQSVLDGCISILKENLSPENCLPIWKMGKEQQLETLKCETFDFICGNYQNVSESNEFFKLDHKDLMEILESDLDVDSELVVYDSVKRWLNHDQESRQDDLCKLLKKVRMPFLPQNILITDSKICKTDGSCFVLFNEALQFQNNKSLKFQDRQNWTYPRNLYNTVIAVGSYSEQEASYIEFYDKNNDVWTKLPEIPLNRANFSSVMFNNKIIMVGGYKFGEIVNTVQSYDMTNGQLTTMPSISQPRIFHAVLHLDNYIYVIGGQSSVSLESVERWDIKKEIWSFTTPMSTGRKALAAVVLNNEIYAIGGSKDGVFLTSGEVFNPKTEKWRSIANLKEARSHFGIAAISGYLYVAGGWADYRLSSVERYDPAASKWTKFEQMSITRANLAGGVLCNKFIVGGGHNQSQKWSVVEEYDPKSAQWRQLAKLNYSRADFNLLTVPWKLVKIAQSPRSDSLDSIKC